MKPSWDDAPEWARYLTMDKDGTWRWHSNTPITYKDAWASGGTSRHAAYQDVTDWEESEEKRP